MTSAMDSVIPPPGTSSNGSGGIVVVAVVDVVSFMALRRLVRVVARSPGAHVGDGADVGAAGAGAGAGACARPEKAVVSAPQHSPHSPPLELSSLPLYVFCCCAFVCWVGVGAPVAVLSYRSALLSHSTMRMWRTPFAAPLPRMAFARSCFDSDLLTTRIPTRCASSKSRSTRFASSCMFPR